MVRLGLFSALVGCLTLGPGVRAQAPAWRFQWKSGQVLTYRVEESIKAVEEVEGTKAEASTKINMTKRWQVLAVDAAGVGTIQLSLTALRQETNTGDEPLIFDSAKPEQSNPQLREQLTKWIGIPLAVLRIDARGQVIEVKESKQGKGTRYESEPPFVLVLATDGGKSAGQSWERSYQVTLEPPQGTGEKFPAVQKYTCKASDGKTASISLATTLATLPPAVADRMPLLPFLIEGEVIFDAAAGRMHSARLNIDQELKGHQSEGSSYRLIRTYKEELAGN